MRRRELSVKGVPLDVGSVQAAHLTCINYCKPLRDYGHQCLGTTAITSISSFESVKRLELCDWDEWGDLSPLGLLSLEDLGCADYRMLFDMLGPGALQNLQSVAVPLKYLGPGEGWSSMVLRESRVKALVAAALVELPLLGTLVFSDCLSPKQYSAADVREREEIDAALPPVVWQLRSWEAGRHVLNRVRYLEHTQLGGGDNSE